MNWVGALKIEQPDGDGRYTHRHSLSLVAQASTKGNLARVVIHNLSSTGLLIESTLELALDDEIEVELPQAQTERARVVWRSEGFYGCQFTSPVSEATISAARLRSIPLQQRHTAPHDQFQGDDQPEATGLSPAQKLAAIIGLGTACWGAVILAALAVL